MIENSATKVAYYGDGKTTVFPYSFVLSCADDIRVAIYDCTNGSTTEITSDFYVDTIGKTVQYPGYAPGQAPATSEQPAVLPSSKKITIYRETACNQLTDLGERYPLKNIEDMVDKLTMISQERDEEIDRCVKVQISSNIDPDKMVDSLIKASAAAVASASAASISENNALKSETAASISSVNATASATAAGASQTAAAISEINAATSAAAATLSQTETSASEIAAATSEKNAAASEKEAGAAKTAAAISEKNAAASEASAAKLVESVNPPWNIRLNYRAYKIGDIVYSADLPSWARLECVTAGTTAFTEPDLSVYTTAGTYIIDGYVKWVLADVRDAAPVGEIQLFYSLHPGYVKANGATVKRSDYPRLVTFAETNNLWVDYTLKFSGTTTANSATVTGISSTDMAKLQREMKVTGTGIPAGTTISKLNRTALTITLSAVATTAGKIDITYGYNENFPERFGVGDGSTTFTLPNAIGRVMEAGTSVGNTAAGLPNITGDISTSANMQTAGAFYGSSGPAYGEYHGDFGHTVFDASRSSVIYGNAATVQAQSLGLLPQLRY